MINQQGIIGFLAVQTKLNLIYYKRTALSIEFPINLIHI